MNKMQKISLLLPAIAAVLTGLIAVSAVTYAWFTLAVGTFTNVTPMEGKISKGDGNLLISENQEGPFDQQCSLNPTDHPQELKPISTENLTKFYTPLAQDREGYCIRFQDSTEEAGQLAIHGTVYLQYLGEACDVYFHAPALQISGDDQVLSAGRLGLKITKEDGEVSSFLFKLDALGSTAQAQQRPTVREDDVVLSGIQGDGEPVFVPDPARSVADFMIDAENRQKLLSMTFEEIAQVEYWLYLEGCDTACYNPVHSQDITLQLGFAGEPVKEETSD